MRVAVEGDTPALAGQVGHPSGVAGVQRLQQRVLGERQQVLVGLRAGPPGAADRLGEGVKGGEELLLAFDGCGERGGGLHEGTA